MDFERVGDITDVETIAVGRGIRELSRLRRVYGRRQWRKMKGIAHWYEAHGIGKKEFTTRHQTHGICGVRSKRGLRSLFGAEQDIQGWAVTGDCPRRTSPKICTRGASHTSHRWPKNHVRQWRDDGNMCVACHRTRVFLQDFASCSGTRIARVVAFHEFGMLALFRLRGRQEHLIDLMRRRWEFSRGFENGPSGSNYNDSRFKTGEISGRKRTITFCWR